MKAFLRNLMGPDLRGEQPIAVYTFGMFWKVLVAIVLMTIGSSVVISSGTLKGVNNGVVLLPVLWVFILATAIASGLGTIVITPTSLIYRDFPWGARIQIPLKFITRIRKTTIPAGRSPRFGIAIEMDSRVMGVIPADCTRAREFLERLTAMTGKEVE